MLADCDGSFPVKQKCNRPPTGAPAGFVESQPACQSGRLPAETSCLHSIAYNDALFKCDTPLPGATTWTTLCLDDTSRNAAECTLIQFCVIGMSNGDDGLPPYPTCVTRGPPVYSYKYLKNNFVCDVVVFVPNPES